MKQAIEWQDNLLLFQAMVQSLLYKNDRVVGVKTNLDLTFRVNR